MTQRAKEAEKIKESVSKVKDKAERIVAQIEVRFLAEILCGVCQKLIAL